MKLTKMAMLISNNFVDFNNYTEAVQNYLDDNYFWYLSPGLLKKADIFIKKNLINLIDDLIQIGQSVNKDFYQVSSMRESVMIEGSDLQVLGIYFRLDSNYDQYSRRVYSIGDLFGQTGGLYSVMLIIGSVFVGLFTEKLFVSSILRKIYQIDQTRDLEIRKHMMLVRCILPSGIGGFILRATAYR